MSKCWAKSTPLSLSEQMRQTLIDTLKTHLPLDLHSAHARRDAGVGIRAVCQCAGA